jgi:hypothetical protein
VLSGEFFPAGIPHPSLSPPGNPSGEKIGGDAKEITSFGLRVSGFGFLSRKSPGAALNFPLTEPGRKEYKKIWLTEGMNVPF